MPQRHGNARCGLPGESRIPVPLSAGNGAPRRAKGAKCNRRRCAFCKLHLCRLFRSACSSLDLPASSSCNLRDALSVRAELPKEPRSIAADTLGAANGVDIMPVFRDRISGRHTAGTSRKIKAVFKLNMKKGLPCAGASAMAASHPKRTRASG